MDHTDRPSAKYATYTGLNMVFAVSTTLIASILPIYLRHLGYTDVQLGMVYAMFSLSIILFLPLIGNLADVLGKKLIILFAIVAELAAIALYLIDGVPAAIAAARMLDAIAAISLMVLSLVKAQDGIRGSRHFGEKTGYFLSLDHIGRTIAAPASVFLADYFFIRMPFFTAATILSLTLVTLFDKRKFHMKNVRQSSIAPLAAIRSYWSHHQLRGMAVLGIAAHATGPAMKIFLPLFIVEKLHAPLSYVGYALFAISLPALAQFYFGRLSDRFGAWKMVLVGLGMSSLGLIALFFVDSFPLLMSLLFLIGIGDAMWNVSAWDLLSTIGKKMQKEGAVLTSYLSIAQTGALAASLASGFVVAAWSFNVLVLANGILVLAACAMAGRALMDEKKA